MTPLAERQVLALERIANALEKLATKESTVVRVSAQSLDPDRCAAAVINRLAAAKPSRSVPDPSRPW